MEDRIRAEAASTKCLFEIYHQALLDWDKAFAILATNEAKQETIEAHQKTIEALEGRIEAQEERIDAHEETIQAQKETIEAEVATAAPTAPAQEADLFEPTDAS